MNRTTETLGNATGQTGWRKTYARNWTPPAQPCGAWGKKMEQTPEQIMQSALDAFGTQRQVDKCLGEMHELGEALLLHRYGEADEAAVIDEIADIFVTAGQMRLHFGAEAVDQRIAVKLARLQQLVADQVAADAEQVGQSPLPQPTPGKTLCVDCPHWHPVMDHPSEYGVCHHPAQPWDTAERRAKDGPYLAATNREEACLLPAPKPVRPALCWSKWQDGYLLLDGTNWRGYVGHLNGRWAADTGTNDRQWFADSASAMREIERRNGLDEVPLWT